MCDDSFSKIKLVLKNSIPLFLLSFINTVHTSLFHLETPLNLMNPSTNRMDYIKIKVRVYA